MTLLVRLASGVEPGGQLLCLEGRIRLQIRPQVVLARSCASGR